MQQAEQRACELIVMASHGRSDVAQFFLGRSVAEQVARDSKIPTIIARMYGPRRTTRPIDRFKRIVYVTDLGENSKHILSMAASLADKTKAELQTLCVFNEGDEEPADGGESTIQRFFGEANATCGKFGSCSTPNCDGFGSFCVFRFSVLCGFVRTETLGFTQSRKEKRDKRRKRSNEVVVKISTQ